MALAPRSDFVGLDGVAHLAAGGETPPLTTQGAAVQRWIDLKGQGPDGAAVRAETMARVKQNAAAILGVAPEEIALASSAGEAVSQVALSLPLAEGDNVVVQDVEFRSASLPWAGLRRRGVEVRVIRHADWSPEETAFAGAADRHTRAIVTSQVNYLTGIHHNLEALRAIADRSGAVLVSDATHAAGAVPVPGRLCDFTISATYKWVLGCQGIALLAWNRERVPDLEPAISGWRSADDWQSTGDPLAVQWKPTAERLEPGNPPWPSLFYLDDGLRYLLNVGIDRIAAHIKPLAAEVNARLRRLELDVATPADPAWHAGNTCYWTADPERIADRLFREHRVLVSGYSGRIRISTHLYNDMEDIDRLFAALER
jgi:selenocysteine lyase/cysteine desulfurase